MGWTLIVVVCWIVIGIFNYGMTFGHFQNNWQTIADLHRKEDMLLALFLGVLGPLTLLAFLIIKSFELYMDHKPKLRIKDIKFW